MEFSNYRSCRVCQLKNSVLARDGRDRYCQVMADLQAPLSGKDLAFCKAPGKPPQPSASDKADCVGNLAVCPCSVTVSMTNRDIIYTKNDFVSHIKCKDYTNSF